ncbi:putative orphan protein, partial [uncultured Gammaproteobacteria bacterium]
MHKTDLDRVRFFSKEDMSGKYQLLKAETILRNATKSDYEDINDVLELYNIKLYIDNKLYLNRWSPEDIALFKQKVSEYSKVVGQFMSNINDNNVVKYYEELFRGYINSFWEIVNNQKIYKQISSNNLGSILLKKPYMIRSILIHRKLVTYYHDAIRNFLLNYSQSTEILLSIYEVKNDSNHKEIFLPKSLTIQDKEDIISKYLDSENVNLNYLQLIQNSKKGSDFKISNKIRLKAKRRCTEETDKIFNERESESFMKYGALISFPEDQKKIIEVHFDNMVANYSYSLDFIKQNNDDYSLFLNFKILFEYTDNQNRINLVSKTNQMGTLERIMGVHSKNEYRHGVAFNMFEMASRAQIFAYNKIINEFGNSIENILKLVFTSIFHKKYNFANNARLSMSSANTSFFEKVRLLAPEFESILKQYKLFVEEGKIDFELLQ